MAVVEMHYIITFCASEESGPHRPMSSSRACRRAQALVTASAVHRHEPTAWRSVADLRPGGPPSRAPGAAQDRAVGIALRGIPHHPFGDVRRRIFIASFVYDARQRQAAGASSSFAKGTAYQSVNKSEIVTVRNDSANVIGLIFVNLIAARCAKASCLQQTIQPQSRRAETGTERATLRRPLPSRPSATKRYLRGPGVESAIRQCREPRPRGRLDRRDCDIQAKIVGSHSKPG